MRLLCLDADTAPIAALSRLSGISPLQRTKQRNVGGFVGSYRSHSIGWIHHNNQHIDPADSETILPTGTGSTGTGESSAHRADVDIQDSC